MKKDLIFLFILFIGMTTSASNKVEIDLTCLKGQNVINFEADWSKLAINKLSVDAWIACQQEEEPEFDIIEDLDKRCKPQIKELRKKVNEKLEDVNLALAMKDGCKYTLRICPLAFDEKGNNKLECLVINNETKETVADFFIEGKGGHFGDMSNLWGDGFEDSGEKLGVILKNAVKKKISVDTEVPNMLNFEVDWSKLVINKLSVEDWIAYHQAEQPEKDAADELENELKPQIVELTKKVSKMLERSYFVLVDKEERVCNYTLLVCPLAFDENGDNILQCLVINNKTQEKIADFIVKGEGGHRGNLSNLWGKGFEDSGEKLGDILQNRFKIYTNKKYSIKDLK